MFGDIKTMSQTSHVVTTPNTTKLIIDNPEKYTLLGNEFQFNKTVIDTFEVERTKWINDDEIILAEIDDSIASPNTGDAEKEYHTSEQKRLATNIRNNKTMQFHVELCKNIKVGTGDDFISMPIYDENGVDGGFLIVYGYLEVEE